MKKIGFIGFGLIGGSLARIWRKNHPDYEIIVYNHHEGISQDYEAAKEDGVLSRIVGDLREFSDCDLVLLCTPVISVVKYLEKLKGIVSEKAIVTDVGSVKGIINDKALGLGMEKMFIGGHPMAGSEKTGYLNSNRHLFENSYYILTPYEETPKEKLAFLQELIKETRAVIITIDAKKHDEVTAAISHVPHIVASSLVNSVADKNDNLMEILAAGGFRDITRIASSSPMMWRDICITNKESIQVFLENYIQILTEFKQSIEENNRNSLLKFFEDSKEYRDSLPLKKSNMAVSHEILLYVPDEPGEIAIISSILAARGISIKNIGIAHNREYSEGVLRVEFYDNSSREDAYRAIKERNYQIFEK